MNNNMKRKLIPVLLVGCFGAAQAAPTLQQVVSGQATFGQQGNVFTITNTPNAIINWQSFSVNAGEVTRFVQQSADSAVLNRITGQDPSQILGALQSNGHVFLLNPNGIMFGRDARIDVNGLTASTLGLSDADFLAGRRNFSAGALAGKVSNQGSITTPHGGKVFLIAANVENSGIINAPNGEVVLAAGQSVQLVDSANPDLRVVVSAPSGEALNLGQLVSQGGKIGIYGALVRQRGLVSANSAVRGADGKIILKASGDTLLEAGSVTTATGAGKGGNVSVLGQRVALTGDARIDASGNEGGGTVLVGGDYQGKNAAVPNARQAWVGKDASVRADAIASGNGGKVVVWSDDATRAFGAISARGGAVRGDGGLVETSGGYLDVNGARVDAGAANGSSGTWLLDPRDIIIDEGGDQPLSDADAFSKNPDQNTRIAPSLINNATTKVVLQATNNIYFNSDVAMTSAAGSLRAEAGNAINVNRPISANGGDLDFRAGNSFTLAGGASLDTSGYIDIKTDNVDITGTIGSATTRPNVSFTPFSTGRAMRISSSKTGADLSLSPTELNQITGYGINIGSSADSGGITVSADYTAGADKTPNLVLETSGSIRVEGIIDLSTNHINSHAVLGRYGDTGGNIEVIETSTIKSASIVARSDSLVLNGSLDAGPAGNITVMPHNATTMISLGGGAYDETGMLGLSNTELGKLIAGSLTIGGNDGQSGRLSVSGAADFSNADKVLLDAGEGNLDIGAALTTNSLLTLKSYNQVAQSVEGIITAPTLEVSGSLVDLAQANVVDVVAGSASSGTFRFGSAGDLSVGQAGTASGIGTLGGEIVLTSGGQLAIDKAINAGAGLVDLSGNGIFAGTHGIVSADSVSLASSAGVGTDSAALQLRTRYLTVDNHHEAGASVINIANTGNLVLGRVLQSGADSTGSITIKNTGTLNIPEIDPFEPDARARVWSGAGAIRLSSTGAMTIDGDVESQSGSIALDAGSGSRLRINATGIVNTATGNISLKGNRVTNAGTVTAPAGSVHIDETAVPPVQPPVTPPVTPPEPPVVTPPVDPVPQKPTLDQCIVAPGTAGCSSVLPSLSQCTAAPSTTGCAVVLPTLAQCVVAPGTVGCSSVLPSLSQCTAAPSTTGCAVVLPTLAQCVVAPGTAGCSSVLPSLSQCTAAPSTTGCAVVLPTLVQCVVAPGTAGCSSVLPSLSQCTAAPSTAGCAVVLPTLAQCVASPTLQGCAAILPTVSSCVANPAAPGCVIVRPTPTQTPGESTLATTLQQQVGLGQKSGATATSTATQPVDKTKTESKKDTDDQLRVVDKESPSGAKDEPRKKTYCN